MLLRGTYLPTPCNPLAYVRPHPPPPWEGGDGHEVTVPPSLHHTMVALKLLQFQYKLQNFFFGAFGA